MNERYHCIYNLQFAQRPFLKKKILVEEPPVLTNLCFQPQEAGEEEGKQEEEEGDEKVVKSHIQSTEDEISKLCQGMLLILYYCALYIMERFS